MSEYKSNSDKSRSEASAAKQKAVIGEGAQTRKPGVVGSTIGSLVSSRIKEVGRHLLLDIVIPMMQKIVMDSANEGLAMMFGRQPSKTDYSRSKPDRASYQNYYDRRDYREARPSVRDNFDIVYYQNRGDAETVLYRMKEQIRDYDAVSVADMYEFSGLVAEPQYNRYGWMDLNSVSISRTRNGDYVIDLPRAVVL